MKGSHQSSSCAGRIPTLLQPVEHETSQIINCVLCEFEFFFVERILCIVSDHNIGNACFRTFAYQNCCVENLVIIEANPL